MIDPNKVTEAINEFIKNPIWKDIFTNAPGGAMERLAIAFYFSKFHDEFKPEDFQEYRDLRDEYEKSMTEEDLNYLIENSDKETAIKHYQELLSKIQGGQMPTGNMRFEKEVQTGVTQEGGEKGEENTTGTEESSQVSETASVEGDSDDNPNGEADENIAGKEDEDKNND